MESNNLEGHKILIIDDEIEIIKALTRQFRSKYSVFSATNTADAFGILEKEDIQVIISDQRMPGMTGVEFFTSIKSSHSESIKLILTGYTDIEAVIDGINKGQIFRYITKPWHPDELESIVNEAVEKYELQACKQQLLKDLSTEKLNLEKKVKERTQELEDINVALSKLIIENDKNLKINEALFNSIPGLIFFYNDDNELTQWNRRHVLMTGYSDKELASRKFLDWFTDDFESMRVADTILNALALNGLGDGEVNFQKKDGTRIPINITVSLVNIQGKRFFAGIGIDITERKKSEAKLEEKLNELEMMNEFMVDREIKMIELKNVINVLLVKMGEKEKYLPSGEEIE